MIIYIFCSKNSAPLNWLKRAHFNILHNIVWYAVWKGIKVSKSSQNVYSKENYFQGRNHVYGEMSENSHFIICFLAPIHTFFFWNSSQLLLITCWSANVFKAAISDLIFRAQTPASAFSAIAGRFCYHSYTDVSQKAVFGVDIVFYSK